MVEDVSEVSAAEKTNRKHKNRSIKTERNKSAASLEEKKAFFMLSRE